MQIRAECPHPQMAWGRGALPPPPPTTSGLCCVCGTDAWFKPLRCSLTTSVMAYTVYTLGGHKRLFSQLWVPSSHNWKNPKEDTGGRIFLGSSKRETSESTCPEARPEVGLGREGGGSTAFPIENTGDNQPEQGLLFPFY